MLNFNAICQNKVKSVIDVGYFVFYQTVLWGWRNSAVQDGVEFLNSRIREKVNRLASPDCFQIIILCLLSIDYCQSHFSYFILSDMYSVNYFLFD